MPDAALAGRISHELAHVYQHSYGDAGADLDEDDVEEGADFLVYAHWGISLEPLSQWKLMGEVDPILWTGFRHS